MLPLTDATFKIILVFLHDTQVDTHWVGTFYNFSFYGKFPTKLA
jgi:hypothetical protein